MTIKKSSHKFKLLYNKQHLHKYCKVFLSYKNPSCFLQQGTIPWQCRWNVGSCCLYDRKQHTGGRSLDEAAHKAAGRCPLPSSRHGGRCAGSGAFHMAVLYDMSGHKKCLEDGMGCCCVAKGQTKQQLFNHLKTKKDSWLSQCVLCSYLVIAHTPFLSEVCTRWTLLFTVAVVKHL